jgi:hypothetical protein
MHAQHTDRIRYVILKLKKKKKSSDISRRDIMPYVFRQLKGEEVDMAINTLCSLGFCELRGSKVRVLDEKAGG